MKFSVEMLGIYLCILITLMSLTEIPPNLWGPSGWIFLHYVTFGFRECDKEDYTHFFNYLGNVIPCRFCRESYKQILETSPPDVSSREALIKWLWDIHNKVNDKTKRSYNNASLEDINKRYGSYLKRGCGSCNKTK
uniref:thiol oxidase n=1 Tax=viral metagenome TaxID=1070528 RepID=A0A6C0FCV5_9ZZZZ|tara:strand:+ start:13652 stop:14059 length:408 start_codon:yes stop_codon:yes gene_type:complete